ncbi:DUF3108 domain-containing protein [Neptunicella marina]|uniref:DUF3108 domain-containing protein n=1 Tax=Neptunicella marina TaxID=2125989 RepID=A0A8J6IXB6_9ALTE|nr:DUF3108 domain-containing protein [Neptunicella marina]MBC3767342.1 DUF3108 domain-containing protein [Neptunicella marina]
MLRNKLLATLLLSLPLCAVANPLCTYVASYKAYRRGSELGHASQQLIKLDNEKYKLIYQSHASIFIFSDHRKETSLFDVNDNQYIPLHYQYERTGTGSDHELNLTFDATNKQLVFAHKPVQPWENEQDNQLYLFQIKDALRAGKTDFVVDLISYKGNKEQYHFQVEKTEKLKLPYGQLEAIKIARIRENSSRETYFWFAPSLDMLMVRLQQIKDGDEQADIRLQSVEFNQSCQP